MRKIPVIIDSDPGVDDSFAIALANSCPDFRIVALTAAEGNVPAALTRKNAIGLREILHMDCAVGFGAEEPLEKPYTVQAYGVHGETGVGTVVFPEPKEKADERPAWDLIYEEAVKAEGELVLFAIGPLTNIALALRKHPDLPKYIKRFCIMGGGTFGNVSKTAEFNIWVDPLAAREVFEKLQVDMVGLNVTHTCAVTAEDFDRMLAILGEKEETYLLRELCRFSKANSFQKWGRENLIIHDALAIAAVMKPQVVKFEPYYVYVEDREEMENVGETVVDREGKSGQKPNCRVAMEADQPLFVEMLMEMCRYYAKR